jgi:alpha-N-acetylglucosaminidase
MLLWSIADGFSFFNNNNNDNNNSKKKSAPRTSVRSSTPRSTQLKAAAALLQRLLPRAHVNFKLSLLPETSDANDVNTGDVFELDNGSQQGQVQIRGSSGVALASGAYWYLKYYCNASVSWGEEGSGDNVRFLDER